MSSDTEDAVFTEEPAVIKVSGSGSIASLIHKVQKTGELKNISKKDCPKATSPARSQRILSVPEQSKKPTENSKVTYRSVSVSPSSRQMKVSSVILSRGKSPPDAIRVTSDLSDKVSPTSQSSGISSLEDMPTFGDTPTNQSTSSATTDSVKPVPKPRLTTRETADGIPATKEPQVEDLKNENKSLKQEISQLKEKHFELKRENEVLLEHLQSSDEFDSPLGSPKSRHKFDSSKPIPIPRSATVSAASNVSPRHQIRRSSDQAIKLETPQSPVPKPRSGSKPINFTAQNDEKAKAVKTLQNILPVGDSLKTQGSSPREVRGSDGLTRTERSLLQLQELMNDSDEEETVAPTKYSGTPSKPTPKVRNLATSTANEEVNDVTVQFQVGTQASRDKKLAAAQVIASVVKTKGDVFRPSPPRETGKETSVARPSEIGVPKKESRPSPPREANVTRPSPLQETSIAPPKKGTTVTRPSPQRETSTTIKKETSVTIHSQQDTSGSLKKETSVTRPPTTKEDTNLSRPSASAPSVTRPSPPRETSITTKKETSVTKPPNTKEATSLPRPSASAPSVTKLSPPREETSIAAKKETSITRPPTTKEATSSPRPSATQGAPSSGSITSADTKTRDSQTPKEPAQSSAPPTRPPPPGQAQKKTQIKSDVSWIKRKDSLENYNAHSSISASQTMPDLNPSPTPTPKYHPYRSHTIISASSPSSGSPYLSPPVTSDTKPPVTPDTKASPTQDPKFSHTRAGSKFKSKPLPEAPKEKKKRSHSFRRSTTEDKISSKAKQEEKKSTSPPKKPPRIRALKTPSNTRPASMMIGGSEYDVDVRSHDLTASGSVGTIPRGTPPQERKKGFLSRFKNKTQYKLDSPPLQEEPDEETESSSDDEKGGTIKRMPKLRHVAVRSKSVDRDDGEPEYHQLFEYVFVVGLEEEKGKLATKITYTFPPAPEQVFSGKDAALLSIPQFCFPDIDQWKPTKSYNSESFSFVLTDMEGGRRFGYCRRLLPSGKGPRLPEVYCIVSPLGCFSLYKKILDDVEERRAVSSSAVFTYLKAIQANPFPRPGRSVEVRAFSAHGTGLEPVKLTRPLDSRLEHVDFSLLFATLSPRKIIQLFTSLLMERRVILCAHSLSLLSGCAHALLALLYPFEWQHVFIPVLPSSLIDFVCSPLPYIIGINPCNIKLLDSMEMEEALVINLEKKKFEMKVGDETSILPTKLFQYLEHSLGSSVISSAYLKKGAGPTDRADEIVVNTFMTFFAYLYGDYKKHMSTVKPSTGEKEFQREDFIKTFSSKSTRRFLKAFHMTQLFENFIEQRENPAKESTTAQSHFEQQLPVLQPRCQEIEIFSSKSRFDRWKLAKGIKKK